MTSAGYKPPEIVVIPELTIENRGLFFDPVVSVEFHLEGFYTPEELRALLDDPALVQRIVVEARCFELRSVVKRVSLHDPSVPFDELDEFLSLGDGGLSPPLSKEN